MNTLSVIIPAYNEEENIEDVVHKCLQVCPGLTGRFELLIIDDGSADGTAKIAQRLASQHNQVKLLQHQQNMGWGSAIKTGLAHAALDWVMYIPSDNQFDPADIAELVPHTTDADIVVAARADRCGYSWVRVVGSAGFILLVRSLFGLRLGDFNFIHLYRREIFEHIEITSGKEFMCAEVLVKAHHAGLRIVEVPGIRCLPRLKGESIKVGPGVVFETLVDMLRVRFSLWKERRNRR